MKCPLCDVEMQIIKSFLIFEGDNSPQEQTKAFRNLELQCRNPQCSGHTEILTHEET